MKGKSSRMAPNTEKEEGVVEATPPNADDTKVLPQDKGKRAGHPEKLKCA